MTPIGRPPLPADERRSLTLQIRHSPYERRLFDQAAAKASESVLEWARSILIAEAERAAARDLLHVCGAEHPRKPR